MRFRLVIEGTNLLATESFIREMGEIVELGSRIGFFTTRTVDAPNLGAATEMAIESIERELKIGDEYPLTDSSDRPFKCAVVETKMLEEVGEIGELDKGRGFSFYVDDE